jgi:two-component system, cell cycle sensor histidine kinase and response regulator CckA
MSIGVVRIVVVEDEAALARSLQKQLRRLGHTDCECVQTEAEAIELVGRTQPDLVFMDVVLGEGGDGARAALAIRQRWGIPSLFLTALADDETLERCKLAEPIGYLLKPFTSEQLHVTLEMALYRERAIRDRLRAEKERSRAESLFAAILDHAPIAILTASDGVVLSSNQAAATLFDRDASSLRGLTIPSLLKADREPAPQETQYQAVAQLASGEETPVLVRRAPFSFDGDPLTNYFVQDLRERLALERTWIEAQSSYLVSKLASGVAHDFNNLLGALQTVLFLVEAQAAGLAGSQVKHLELAIERGSWLTSQLAQLAKYTDRKSELLDLAEYVLALEPLLRRLIPREVSFRIESSGHPTPLRISTAMLLHLLLSLMLNAHEAMPTGGDISVRISRVDGFACLEVEDSGCGMTPEVLAQAFEPLFTTKPSGSATGLGLPTVRRHIDALGGSIELESEVGRGTRARLYFPLDES